MRLLQYDNNGNLSLTEFFDSAIPKYAILSHTWGAEEVTFEDLQKISYRKKAGYKKIRFCGEQARRDGLQYFWVDTCCIDKSSSAELTEAINSMFRWYRDSTKCYVYLTDVDHVAKWGDSFQRSRWFTRGWTLQELIAPKEVNFFARDGTYLGNKSSIESILAEITGISTKVLRGHSLSECTVEERMSWAEARRTKREEDQIYSLLGIFDVSMPVIYGEGRAKAKRRLSFEIRKNCKLSPNICRGHVRIIEPCHSVEVSIANNTAIHDSMVTSILDCEQPLNEQLRLQLCNTLQELQAQLATSLPSQADGSLALSAIATIPKATQDSFEHHLATFKPSETSTQRDTAYGQSPLSIILLKLSQTLFALVSLFGFETWSSFRPEEYALYEDGPRLICYSSILDKGQRDTSVIVQDMFVAKSRRNWIRIRLKLTINVKCAYWMAVGALVTNTLSDTPRKIGYRPVPDSLILLIRKLLNAYPHDISDDAELDVYLDEDSQTKSTFSDDRALRSMRSIDLETTDECQKFTQSLRHYYSPPRVVLEEDLVSAYVNGIALLANLDNRWVAYRIATAGQIGFSLLRRSITAGIALRGEPHVTQILGVVMNSKKTLLKGMLVELPSKGPMFTLMAVHRSTSNPVPWPVRQKWAKQIVHGVAAFHNKDQVIGGLRTFSWCVCIDEHDNAVVMNFSHGSHPSVHGKHGLLPPEYRTEAFKHSNGHVGPEFDIFQLGLLLWHLYRDDERRAAKALCSLDKCRNTGFDSCIYHDDPIALPKPGLDVPQYLNEIITLCRQKDPRQRPAAWKLVNMFPTYEEVERELVMVGDINLGAYKGTATLSRLETVRNLYGPSTICDICEERCINLHYYCEVCELGNYDVCQKCFAKGLHCCNTTHFLIKVDIKDACSKALGKKICYSGVNEHGERAMAVF